MAGIVILFVIIARVVMVERRVSKGYSDVFRAESAAQAGVEDASNLLLDLFDRHPDSVTFWDPNVAVTTFPAAGNDAKKPPGTVFMFRDGNKVYARPLISSASTREYYPSNSYSQSLVVTGTNSIDINLTGAFGNDETKAWVGALPGKTPTPIPVPWVEVLQDPSKAKDDKTNPAVARYAFWVDDESFKLNLNTAKAALRGKADEEVKTVNGVEAGNPKPSLQGIFAGNAAAEQVAQGIETTRDSVQVAGGQFLSAKQIAHATEAPSGLTPEEMASQYQFLLTTVGSGLDLSRGGFKRFNLNEAVDRSVKDLPKISYGSGVQGPDLTGAEDKAKRAVDQIAAAIDANAPSFGQRFYRAGTTLPTPTNYKTTPARNASQVSVADAKRYVQKLAVNIYDYISPARNPLLIDKNGVPYPYQPLFSLADLDVDMMSISQENPIGAIGKKAAPYITEWLMHAKILSVTPTPGGGPNDPKAEFELEIDHYFEFWNMSDKDILPSRGDLGPDPVLVLQNQPWISAANDTRKNGEDIPVGRAFEIKLDGSFTNASGQSVPLVFKAGEVTVITTDPNYAANTVRMGIVPTNFYVARELWLPGGGRRADQGVSAWPHLDEVWVGSASGASVVDGTTSSPNVRRFRMHSYFYDDGNPDKPEVQMGPEWANSQSRRELPKVLLANRFGLITAQPFLVMGNPTDKSNLIAFRKDGSRAKLEFNNFRGSFLDGDEVGIIDPRSALEAQWLDRGSKDEGFNLSAFKVSTVSNPKDESPPQGKSSLGAFASPGAAANFYETDYTLLNQGAPSAPMVVANTPMRSIAELGHVYDPIRLRTMATIPQDRLRGGGRTLTVGQPDVFWDEVRGTGATEAQMSFELSASREWTAWRLADIFTIRPDDDRKGESKTTVEGLYNPNGILRDGGLVLRSLVEGLKFPSDAAADPTLSGQQLNTAGTESATTGLTYLLPQTVTAGGPALARYLAQRLSRSIANADRRFSPLWEPGELSQLQLFSPFATGTAEQQILSGAKTSKLNDRSREELFRRLADLITTRGNTFAIYVVGQSLDKLGRPLATQAKRVTVRLSPVWDDPLEEDFDPSSPNDRFRQPDRWKIEILSTENA